MVAPPLVVERRAERSEFEGGPGLHEVGDHGPQEGDLFVCFCERHAGAHRTASNTYAHSMANLYVEDHRRT